MTDEELRELDAEVHRVVFGFTDLRLLPVYGDPESGTETVTDSSWLKDSIFGTRLDWCYLPDYEHDEKGDLFCEVVPHYSTDIADAWKVVEKLQRDRRTVMVRAYNHVSQYQCMIVGGGVSVADSAPLAIVKAVLAASASSPPLTPTLVSATGPRRPTLNHRSPPARATGKSETPTSRGDS